MTSLSPMTCSPRMIRGRHLVGFFRSWPCWEIGICERWHWADMARRGTNMGTHQRWRKASVSLLLVGILGCGAAIISQPKVFSQAKIGEDRFVQIGDHTIHFVEVGEGPAIVLIPGG